MKKIAATFLLTGVLAVAGFAAPANAAPKSDTTVKHLQQDCDYPVFHRLVA